jgi:hypothetical protein
MTAPAPVAAPAPTPAPAPEPARVDEDKSLEPEWTVNVCTVDGQVCSFRLTRGDPETIGDVKQRVERSAGAEAGLVASCIHLILDGQQLSDDTAVQDLCAARPDLTLTLWAVRATGQPQPGSAGRAAAAGTAREVVIHYKLICGRVGSVRVSSADSLSSLKQAIAKAEAEVVMSPDLPPPVDQAQAGQATPTPTPAATSAQAGEGAETEGFQIFVRVEGRTVTLQVTKETTLTEVKAKLQARMGWPVNARDRCRLSWGLLPCLFENATLATIGITHGTTFEHHW